MSRKNINFDCPWSVEDNIIKDHVGGTLRKEWLLNGAATIGLGGTVTVTISDLSGGLVVAFDDYFVLAQILDAAPVILPKVDLKTSGQFQVTGDVGAVFSLTVLGYERINKKTGKWAYQYCEYCKVLGLKALIGSAVPWQIAAGYSVTCSGAGAGNATFEVATQTTGSDTDPDTGYITYRSEGMNVNKPYGLKKMKNNDYSVFIAPVQAPGTVGYPVSRDKDGFTITGGANLKYDVLVFGEIEQ